MSRGGLNDHPSPMNVLFRLRMILLGKNPGILQDNVNSYTKGAAEDQFVVSSVFKQIGLQVQCEEIDTSLENNVLSEKSVEEEEEVQCINLEQCETIPPNEIQSVEEGGQSYAAGWVAKQFKHKYNFLGQFTSQGTVTEDNSWIRCLSEGGLVEPSKQWMDITRVCEIEFNIIDKQDCISKDTGVVRSLTEKVAEKFPSFPKEVILKYIKIRTIIRMNYLNNKLFSNKTKKRVNENLPDDRRKRINKMKKIVT